MTQKYLAGRSAIVTGGASGMGRAIAIALARHGANVTIGSYTRKNENDISHPENIDTYLPTSRELDETVDELKSAGVHALALHHDAGSFESCQSLLTRQLKPSGVSISFAMPLVCGSLVQSVNTMRRIGVTL